MPSGGSTSLAQADRPAAPKPSARPAPRPAAGSPEETALKASQAMAAGRYDEFSKMMDPATLKSFHSAVAELLDQAVKSGKNQMADQILPVFGIKTLDELKALDDTKFFAAFSGGAIERDPNLKATMSKATFAVLGHVDEPKDLAHVVCRVTMTVAIDGKDEKVDSLNVMSLRKLADGWKLLPANDIDAFVAILKKAITGTFPDLKPGDIKIRPVGRVMEGADTVHVVYRGSAPLGGAEASKLKVLTVTRDDADWDKFNGPMDQAFNDLVAKRVSL
jgi:hypothetical protein